MIRLLIVDDHLLLREGIKCMLGEYSNLQIVAEACNGEEALRAIRANKFDVVLTDINMPKVNGIELVRRANNMKRNVKCIILSAYVDEKYITEAIKAGARGYILKTASADIIAEAIKNVHAGERYFHEDLPKRLQKIADKTIADLDVKVESYNYSRRSSKEQLTLREMEMMSLISRGFRNRDIARQLMLSEKTVKNHLTNIFRKLGVNDRTQALCVAVQQRMVTMQ